MPDRAARVTRSLSDSSIRNIRLQHQSTFIQSWCSPGVTATVADCPRLTFATTAPSIAQLDPIHRDQAAALSMVQATRRREELSPLLSQASSPRFIRRAATPAITAEAASPPRAESPNVPTPRDPLSATGGATARSTR